ncbi:MAG: hypothetical protein JST82_11095 [Bacteroidetes bacterium]|nr:hypothetical protein [Bacteroidota bacterium]
MMSTIKKLSLVIISSLSIYSCSPKMAPESSGTGNNASAVSSTATQQSNVSATQEPQVNSSNQTQEPQPMSATK